MPNSKFLAYEFQVVNVPKSAPSLVGVASGCGKHPHTYMLYMAKVEKLLLLKLRHEDIYYSKETSPEMCHKKITTPNKVRQTEATLPTTEQVHTTNVRGVACTESL